MTSSVPSQIELLTKSKMLSLRYPDGQHYQLSAEFLRVHSPSAEVRGHGFGQEKLQSGKRHVGITGIEPVGNYGVKIIFDDGHDTGIYTWQYLKDLGDKQDLYWQEYLSRLSKEGLGREP